MQILPLAAIAVLLIASGASAQQAGGSAVQLGTMKPNTDTTGNTSTKTTAPGGEATMADLVSRGYEIKAAVPNGGKFIVFMQKDQSAYACEFQSLTGTRCGSIN